MVINIHMTYLQSQLFFMGNPAITFTASESASCSSMLRDRDFLAQWHRKKSLVDLHGNGALATYGIVHPDTTQAAKNWAILRLRNPLRNPSFQSPSRNLDRKLRLFSQDVEEQHDSEAYCRHAHFMANLTGERDSVHFFPRRSFTRRCATIGISVYLAVLHRHRSRYLRLPRYPKNPQLQQQIRKMVYII